MNTIQRYEHTDDKEANLVSLLKSHDEAAFKEVVETYQNKVYNLCLGFLKNEGDAEDIAQEVFIEVYNSIASFQEGSTLSTWIYRIAVNKSLEVLRKNKRKKTHGLVNLYFWQ
ncbi:RNA polymerase sigma factor [Fulvivirga maritima]|uniref:RNA polymerase sigma factor n=1 Tax=Fulvivirga maritima TaxID=2904247 RepID=UPI00210833B4|nr:sigma-70 family RNA polymerase sigma factor [Fulvivirga maritima]